jgi:hypothetical protein
MTNKSIIIIPNENITLDDTVEGINFIAKALSGGARAILLLR